MKLTGVMPALVTPFDQNDKIDFNALEKHMTNLREAGVESDPLLSARSLSP